MQSSNLCKVSYPDATLTQEQKQPKITVFCSQGTKRDLPLLSLNQTMGSLTSLPTSCCPVYEIILSCCSLSCHSLDILLESQPFPTWPTSPVSKHRREKGFLVSILLAPHRVLKTQRGITHTAMNTRLKK